MYYYLTGYSQGYYYYPEANSTVAMDGMVLPQSSALHADSEFAGRCAPGDSNITLWQFLLELLRDGGYPHLIQWTNREGEFKLLNAEGVAQLWGKRKGKEHMNYDKLSRALRYYYDKNIIKKVIGQKFVYRFVGNHSEGPANESWNTAPKPEPLSYLQQYARATVTTGMKNMMNGQMQQMIPKREDLMMPFVPTSTSLSSPPQMQTTDLASLNLSGVSTSSHDTPSPTDSSCSPNSICSSSGVSSAVPTAATTPPTCNSRPSSAHSDDGAVNNNSYGFQPLSRKRKASPPPPIKVEKDSHSRRCRPENLNLSSAQYLNPTLPMVISPMNVISQMSPFLLNQQMQLYALASASFGPNSPLFSANLGVSPLSTPKMPSVFQFPPVSASVSVASTLANLMSPAIMSAGLGGAGSIFKFPGNDILKTPTIPSLAKTVPVANSDS